MRRAALRTSFITSSRHTLCAWDIFLCSLFLGELFPSIIFHLGTSNATAEHSREQFCTSDLAVRFLGLRGTSEAYRLFYVWLRVSAHVTNLMLANAVHAMCLCVRMSVVSSVCLGQCYF